MYFPDFRNFFLIFGIFVLDLFSACGYFTAIPARSRVSSGGLEARETELGAAPAGRVESCARAASGSPAGHYDPARCLRSEAREPDAPEDAAVERREASAPTSLARGDASQASRCPASRGANGAGSQPHQRLPALRSLAPRGAVARMQMRGRHRGRPGEAVFGRRRAAV
jgi:hypothetical protein